MSVTTMRRDQTNIDHYEDRVENLTIAFRWAVKYNLHEAVANHFSLAVNDDGSRFLMEPNQRRFRVARRATLFLDHQRSSLEAEDAPDPTAWGLHGSIHRQCPHARCILAHPFDPRHCPGLAGRQQASGD